MQGNKNVKNFCLAEFWRDYHGLIIRMPVLGYETNWPSSHDVSQYIPLQTWGHRTTDPFIGLVPACCRKAAVHKYSCIWLFSSAYRGCHPQTWRKVCHPSPVCCRKTIVGLPVSTNAVSLFCSRIEYFGIYIPNAIQCLNKVGKFQILPGTYSRYFESQRIGGNFFFCPACLFHSWNSFISHFPLSPLTEVNNFLEYFLSPNVIALVRELPDYTMFVCCNRWEGSSCQTRVSLFSPSPHTHTQTLCDVTSFCFVTVFSLWIYQEFCILWCCRSDLCSNLHCKLFALHIEIKLS